MIFDVIYDFYLSLFVSNNDVSSFWMDWPVVLYNSILGEDMWFWGVDVLCATATAITIICGIFALFRILGGILKLFKV